MIDAVIYTSDMKPYFVKNVLIDDEISKITPKISENVSLVILN